MSLAATITTIKHRWVAQAPSAKAQIKPETPVRDYFPHLPPYSDPTTGFVAQLPKPWIPYAQLMRLDRPAGFYAFYVPYAIGTVYSACIASSSASIASVVGFLAFLVPLNIVLRGIGCAFNDNVDQDFDRKVTRCRHRPIARGAINTSQAHLFTLALTLLLVPFVAWLPQACWLQMSGITVTFCLYALAKRVTYYPQVVLGIPFSWAVFFCLTAFDVSLETHLWSSVSLFGSLWLWTIAYDTIYAHQDVKDDEKAGVKGMALRFRHSTKLLAGILAICQVFLLAVCGALEGFGIWFYVLGVGGVATTMAQYIYDVDLTAPESCGRWFHIQFWTVGGAFMAGFVGEFLLA